MMKSAWGDIYDRNLEQLEFIDIRKEEDLINSWSEFIHTHHYDYWTTVLSVSPHKNSIWINEIGESMKNAGILPDDIVVCHQNQVVNNGDIVVAMIEDEATVKRFYKENGHIRLQPENDTMDPIILDNVTILGKAVGLYRKI